MRVTNNNIYERTPYTGAMETTALVLSRVIRSTPVPTARHPLPPNQFPFGEYPDHPDRVRLISPSPRRNIAITIISVGEKTALKINRID